VGYRRPSPLLAFLELSEATDLEILTSTLETWVDNYREEILPVALQLTQRLAGSYMKNIQDIVANENTENQNAEADDDADSKMYAAAALLKTIGSIVTAMDGSLEILGQIQQVLIPLIQITLNHCIIDLLDGTFDLIDSLIFNLKSVDPGMWPVFEQTYKIFKVNAVDFLEEMLPSLDNFMSYGKEVFYARADYCEIILDIYESTMANTQGGENDCVTACKLIESLLLNLRGHVIRYVYPCFVSMYRLIARCSPYRPYPALLLLRSSSLTHLQRLAPFVCPTSMSLSTAFFTTHPWLSTSSKAAALVSRACSLTNGSRPSVNQVVSLVCMI
jgi:hypothetical protein